MQGFRSDQSSESAQPKNVTLFQRQISRSLFVAVLCGLSLVAAGLTWVGLGSPGKAALFGSSMAHPPIPGAVPEPGNGRLTLSEKVAMDLLGGIRTPETKRPTLAKEGAEISRDERALLAALESGSEAEALNALRALAALGGPANRLRLAAIMKDNAWPEALRTEAAKALLETGDAAEKALAVRALSVIGGEANTEALSTMVKDLDLPEALRLEAALGLGQIGTSQAGDGLLEAFWTFSEPDIHEQLLGALGNFPFHQIESLWKEYLDDPNTSSELRVAAVDALSNSSYDALPFLANMAETDQDPEVREMSAWAISAHAQTGAMGPELTRMVQAEPEPDVRRRLYEALTAQTEYPSDILLPLIQAENDLAARVAGFNALGEAIKTGRSGDVAATFDANIVPELRDVAVSQENLNLRMRAVFALRRADTVAARQALEFIATTANPKIAQAARHGLKPAK